jgi:AcrR family transcriptional regulator
MRAPRLPATERRNQILDVAVTIFARESYAAAGTADIAAAVGVGEPTIYRYFPSKRELYIAALRRADEEVLRDWRRIVGENADPLNALLLLGTWYHQTLRERPQILQIRSRAMSEPPDAGIAAAVRETYLGFRQFIEDLFVRARDEGRLVPDADIRTLTWLFMAIGALLDIGHELGFDEELTPADLMAMANAVLERRFTQPRP